VPAYVNPTVTHALEDGIQPGGAQDPRLNSFVRITPLPVNVREELVRHDGAGQLVAVHHLGGAVRQDVDVAHQRNVEALLFHEQQHFMKLSRVVSQLGNNELRSRGDLLLQFVILGHLLRLGRLERRNDGAGEEITGMVPDDLFASRILQPPVHFRDQLQDMNRVQIEDRCWPSLMSRYWIIAAHYQEIPDPSPLQGVKLAFHGIAVFVFTGEVDERIDAEADDFTAHKICGHGRGSARIVGQGQGMDHSPGSRLAGEGHDLLLGRFPGAPARHQFPGDGEDGGVQQSFFETIIRHCQFVFSLVGG